MLDQPPTIEPAPPITGGSQSLAWWQLLRLPNVFTALADVAMGFLITHASSEPRGQLAALAAASACLYLAGMVLNDFFDRELDARERPERPIPSGRVSAGAARTLGFGLLGAGLAAGGTGSILGGESRSVLVAVALATMVVTYDAWLKRTPLGPLAMGACRSLNVLLGMSAATAWHPMHWIVAAGIGTYIAGVTWFARTEATESHRGQLALATLVLLAGLALLAWYPSWSEADLAEESWPRYALRLGQQWYLFWGVLAVLLGWRAARAIVDPSPLNVQRAVRNCIMSLIVLDAAICVGVRGPYHGAAIVLLIFPAMLLGRWVYST